MKATKLETHVLCANTIKEHALMILENELPFFIKNIGNDVFKANGEFKEKYKKEKNQEYKYKHFDFNYDWHINTHYYFEVESNKIVIQITTSVWGGGTDQNGVNLNNKQERLHLYLFTLENGKIHEQVEIDYAFLKQRYSVKEILKKAEKVKIAKQKYEKALGLVPYIFRETLYLKRI